MHDAVNIVQEAAGQFAHQQAWSMAAQVGPARCSHGLRQCVRHEAQADALEPLQGNTMSHTDKHKGGSSCSLLIISGVEHCNNSDR